MRTLIAICVLAGCHDDPVNSAVGNACVDGRDCEQICERGGEFPDGFCTLACRDDNDCTSDSICAEVDQGICLFPCRDDRDCDILGVVYVCKERRDTFDRQIFVCLGR